MQPVGTNNLFNSMAFQSFTEKSNQQLVDPQRYADFTVEVGEETSSRGILGGVLSQEDYDKFMGIIKDLNVLDASHNEMAQARSRLFAAGLLAHDASLTMTGAANFNEHGQQINADRKFNQLGYQHKTLPLYSGKDTDQVRTMVIDSFKVVTAIANASPVTGQTVSADISFAKQNSAGVQVDISEFAQRLAAGEDIEEDKEPDLMEIIKALQLAAQMRREAEQHNEEKE